MSNLLIVESPSKAKTIKKYLGRGYEVIASMGHVRDLPKSKIGVDIENDFTPVYQNIRGKDKLIKELKAAAKKSENIYLAADPDREGEAISWHLASLLGIDEKSPVRVTFNEITKAGVLEGIKHPRPIDMNLFDAQQARRILDRIVGYKISPILWKKVRAGLSAGRVQSVAVRIIVDREEEIRAFTPEEYWTIEALLSKLDNKGTLSARFYGKGGKKQDLKTKEETDRVITDLKGEKYLVKTVKKGTRKKNPAPPFITSTLQQEAARRFGFSASRTMSAAQKLYEGIEVAGFGITGLITYMRTDSYRISQEAQDQAKTFVLTKYGKEYLPSTPNVYKSKGKTAAQDAHEAIRPTNAEITPELAKQSLGSDEYKIYKLVWERFIASQMTAAIYDTVNAEIEAGKYLFKASGLRVKFAGFTVLYEEKSDEESEQDKMLPPLIEGEELKLEKIESSQHFTEPPPRYTEASLIKFLDENGIGRPSTYAPTITTIISRGYVERNQKALVPTPLGEITTKMMKEQFREIVDIAFTAGMEDKLDQIEDGKQNWIKMLHIFYDDFDKTLKQAEVDLEGKRYKVPDEESDEICELCGRQMVIKTGRFGKFLACPGYPECKNTKKIVKETVGVCPSCGGKVIQKKSKKGRIFYGCENYPKCTFVTWDEPISEKCPDCDSTLFKKGGKDARIECLKEGCNYERPVEKE